jgi:hypothetical protein
MLNSFDEERRFSWMSFETSTLYFITHYADAKCPTTSSYRNLLLFLAKNRLTSQDYFLPLAYLHPSNARLLQSKRSQAIGLSKFLYMSEVIAKVGSTTDKPWLEKRRIGSHGYVRLHNKYLDYAKSVDKPSNLL